MQLCVHACVCTTLTPALAHLIIFRVGIILRPLRRQKISGTSISTSMLSCKVSHKQGLKAEGAKRGAGRITHLQNYGVEEGSRRRVEYLRQ